MTEQYAMYLLAVRIASMATKGFLIDLSYEDGEGFHVYIKRGDQEWTLDRSGYFPTITLQELDKIEQEARDER